MRTVPLLLWLLGLGACAVPQGRPAPASAPAPAAPAASGPLTELVVTADRRASAAGLAMLRAGGAPIDAAVAAQAVLGLVEPQASGFGGGSVLLVWDAALGKLGVIDGTPRAGAAAGHGLNEGPHGRTLDPAEVAHGGGAVGVPRTLWALRRAHVAGGRLPWADLFRPAIKLAEDGFAMPRGLHDLLAAPGARDLYGEAATPYLLPDGSVPDIGAMLRNPAYAATLRRVAALGPAGLYDGAGRETLAALGRGAQPSRLTLRDLLADDTAEDPPLCEQWREWRVCTASPPAFGGLVALQMLGMAGTGDLSDPGFAHTFLDAGRLAQADRRHFVADPRFCSRAAAPLLDPDYLAQRAALIPDGAALMHPKPGDPPDTAAHAAADPGAPTTATSQIVVVAKNGDALSMTTSLTHLFGARVAAGGVVFNNALVNFAPTPPSGVHYENEMAPGKRPATPFAPVMAFGPDNALILLGGSGGGPFVPDVVAQTLIEILGNHRPPAEALARPHLSSADPEHVAVEAGTDAEALLPALRAMGYHAQADKLPSGSAFALHRPDGWLGAADPRRDGVVLGE